MQCTTITYASLTLFKERSVPLAYSRSQSRYIPPACMSLFVRFLASVGTTGPVEKGVAMHPSAQAAARATICAQTEQTGGALPLHVAIKFLKTGKYSGHDLERSPWGGGVERAWEHWVRPGVTLNCVCAEGSEERTKGD